MLSKRNLIIVQMLVLTSGSISTFVPVEIPALHSTQCRETNLDMSSVLKTVQEMISSPTPSSYPLSCLEVKENSPSSPSGYYTLSDGIGNTSIVYCNMDDLYSCPSLEQTLRRIELSLDQKSDTITSQLDSVQDFTDTLSTAISMTINDSVKDMLSLTQELINLHSPASCLEAVTETYFGNLCNISGSWTRVAFLNMSDSTQNCISDVYLYQKDGVRACGRQLPSNGFSCKSIKFPVNQTTYSQVCGRVIGYQYYKTDGFDTVDNIDGAYVDGVSLTHGSPRQHIWSFAAAQNTGTYAFCPCAGAKNPPEFVGSDYFCESGSNGGPVTKKMYTSDPLWDGQGCEGGEATCCQTPGIPWFHKVLNNPTTDFIELRICGGKDEDTPLSLYEIYVK